MSKSKRRVKAKGAAVKKKELTPAFGFWLPSLLLLGVLLLAYWPALPGRPIWDDDAHLTRSELKSVEGLGQIWTELGVTRQYYPIVHSAFWFGNHFWGHSVFPYHLINVLLHCASALLLVRILQKLEIRGAWLAGAIFALHPVQVESVAWISELKNTLSGFFYFAAAWFYLRFDQRRNRVSYVLSLSLFALGLLSKSVIATLPAVLLVLFWWRKGKLSWKSDFVPLLPFFIFGVASGLFTAWVERHYIGAEGQWFDLSALERCLLAGRVFWFYLAKLLWPAKLTFIYPRWQVSALIWWQYLFTGAALICVALTWWVRERWRGPLAALLIFGGTLFPVFGFMNVYPFIYSFVADHFQYLASVGIIVFVAAGITSLAERWGKEKRIFSYSLQALLLLGLAILTWRQAHMYRNADVLYQTTLERNPSCWLAHNNLGIELLEKGQVKEAITHYQQAIAIEPRNAESYTNLGNAYMVEGHAADAVGQYEKTLQLSPRAVQPKNNLAWLLATSRDPALRNAMRAVKLAEEAVEISRSKDPVILRTLAAAYAQNGRFEEASLTAEKGLRLVADNEPFAEKFREEAARYRSQVSSPR